MLGRLHTVAALGSIALIPLVPLGLWAYAKTASVDRGSTLARNAHLYRSLAQPAGARLVGSSSYPVKRWDVDGSMVPVVGYRTEYFLRLPRSVPLARIYAHYERALRGWREQRDSESVVFERAHVVVAVTTAETANGGQAREYGLYVSQ